MIKDVGLTYAIKFTWKDGGIRDKIIPESNELKRVVLFFNSFEEASSYADKYSVLGNKREDPICMTLRAMHKNEIPKIVTLTFRDNGYAAKWLKENIGFRGDFKELVYKQDGSFEERKIFSIKDLDKMYSLHEEKELIRMTKKPKVEIVDAVFNPQSITFDVILNYEDGRAIETNVVFHPTTKREEIKEQLKNLWRQHKEAAVLKASTFKDKVFDWDED